MSKTAPLPRQTRLLSSCAVAVIAALTVHMPVRAQTLPALTPAEFQQGGFQGIGTPTVKDSIPTAFIDHEGTNTLVTVNSPRAIINWTPHDNRVGQGNVNFLPEGRTADFVNNPDFGVQDYIVLNRILPQDNSRAIALNGTITSTVNEARGGQVWFYSPGGILVGKDATINVGSLLLTANDLNNQDGFINGTSNTFTFAAAGGSRAAVEVQGTINAGSRNAYVALIAPRVVQSATSPSTAPQPMSRPRRST
jgi:filamentous hemagglutinin family protein